MGCAGQICARFPVTRQISGKPLRKDPLADALLDFTNHDSCPTGGGGNRDRADRRDASRARGSRHTRSTAAASERHHRQRLNGRTTSERRRRDRIEHDDRHRAWHLQPDDDALHQWDVHQRRHPRRDQHARRRCARRERDERGDRWWRAVRDLGGRKRHRRDHRESHDPRHLLPPHHAERGCAVSAHPQRAPGERRSTVAQGQPERLRRRRRQRHRRIFRHRVPRRRAKTTTPTASTCTPATTGSSGTTSFATSERRKDSLRALRS